jgi:type VI secretion system protein ImpL
VPPRPGAPGAQAADQITTQVFATYDAEYARAWVDFLDDLRLKRAARNDDAVRQAQVLAGRDGPLAVLLRKVVEQSAPVARASAQEPEPDAAPTPAGASSRLGRQPALAPAPGPEERLRQLRQFVLPAADGHSGLDAALGRFNEIRVLRSLTSVAGASFPASPNSPASAAAATSDIATASADRLEQLRVQARRDPEPVRSMLLALAVLPAPATAGALAPSADAADAVHPGGRKLSALGRLVLATVGAPCAQSVPGRFPFDRGAAREIPLDEFARLFASGGTFGEAFDRLLASRVDVTTEPWMMRDHGADLDPADLARFHSAARIRSVFFAHGAAQPSLKLTFRPVDLDDSIDRVQIEIDGQPVRYAHGPQTPTLITWPGPQTQGAARLDVVPPIEGAAPLVFAGRWALFRLMDHAAILPGGTGGRFRVVFNIGGRRATFDVDSDSGVNPFRLPELERFDCPAFG